MVPQFHTCLIQPQDELMDDVGCCPSINFIGTYFKMGRVCQDSICRVCSLASFLSGSHAVMSGLSIVTDALVSVDTRRNLSPIHPLAFKLSFKFSCKVRPGVI